LFGRGLVLTVLIHLLVEQGEDLMKKGNLDSWFSDYGLIISINVASLYWIGNFVLLLVLGFLF